MHLLLLETIALIGATVHTMEPGTEPGGVMAPAPAVVLIEDGLIVAVGPDVVIPEDAERVELTGLHLVPGLIDGFCTLDADHDALWLASGVTTVRDSGTGIAQSVPEKTLSMRDRHPGPQLLIASPMFVSSASTRGDGFVLGPAELAADQIAELLELIRGANVSLDFFHHDGTLSDEQLRVVCQTGLEYGVQSWGPLPAATSVAQARAAGQRGLIGLDSLLPPGARFDSLDDEQLTLLDAAVNDLAAGGWMVSPLLMGTARILRGVGPEEPAVLAAMGPLYEMAWRADLETFRMMKDSSSWPRVQGALDGQRALALRLHEAGIQLVPASGAPSGGIAPGAGLIDELEEWVAAGIPAPEVLTLATREAAKAVGGALPSGMISPGHQANLLALASDPRRSISALRSPEVMVLRGKLREGFELEESVALLVEAQAAARLDRSRPIELEAPPMPPGETLASGMLEVKAYSERTAVERYEVTQLAKGRLAYGARILVPSSPSRPARQLVMVQVIHEGLVEFFELTLDQLDEEGQPQLQDGYSALRIRGQEVAGTRKLAVERARFGKLLDSKRSEEAIAAIDGSMALLGLIAAKHFPEGPNYVMTFDEVAMEPAVDRLSLAVDPDLHRIDLSSQRSQRTFGLSGKGEILFAARATAGGRLDGDPRRGMEGEVTAFDLPAGRSYSGDPASWAEDALAAPASAPTTPGDER